MHAVTLGDAADAFGMQPHILARLKAVLAPTEPRILGVRQHAFPLDFWLTLQRQMPLYAERVDIADALRAAAMPMTELKNGRQ